MRRIIDKKTAFRAVLALLTIIAVFSIWPYRLWTNVVESYEGGNRCDVDQIVNPDNRVAQKFVAQYDRISSVDVYVTGIENGYYLDAYICKDVDTPELCRTFVDMSKAQLPGYIKVPFEYDLEVGEEYCLYVKGCRSKFFVDYTDIPDDTAYLGSLYLSEQEIPGRHLDARYNYRLPISKKTSVILISIILAVAAALYAAIGFYYNKFKEKNSLLTVGKVIKYTANPIAAAFFATLMIMVFPLRIFDKRPLDIIFYEIGLIICAFIVFYAINHKSVKLENGVSFFDKIEGADRLRYILMMFSLAMAVWYSCSYVNAQFDTFAAPPLRLMIIWLNVMMLLTFTWSEILTVPNAIWFIASIGFGIRYYLVNMLPDSEKEYDIKNLTLKYSIMIVILGGFVIINLLWKLYVYITDKESRETGLSGYSILFALFLASIIIMRNNKWWGIAMAVIYGCLCLRLLVWKGRENWTKIVAGGLMMNFAISLGFSLLHRYFPGYTSGRFGFIFHNQNVTAEYLIVMGGVATVLLAAKIVAFPKGLGLKELFKSAWKEMILFGWISAYAIFTVSRTAYVSLFMCVFAVLFVVSARHKKQFVRILATMIAAVILCFPAAFTLQRTLPAMVARPVFYFADDADPFVRGGASWDNSNFMCVERFANLFEDKILGMDVSDYDYPNDILNYDMKTGTPILDHYGHPYEGSDEEQGIFGRIESPDGNVLLASATSTRAEYMLLAAMSENVSCLDETSRWDALTNGRYTIAKLYIPLLNMTGHEEQPCWPDGEPIYHAHNTYLQVAYDYGIIAGILFTVFIICGLVIGARYYKRNEKKEPLSLLAFSIIIGFAVAGLTESVFELGYPMTVALLPAIMPLMFKFGSKK